MDELSVESQRRMVYNRLNEWGKLRVCPGAPDSRLFSLTAFSHKDVSIESQRRFLRRVP